MEFIKIWERVREILGMGCQKCSRLMEAAKKAAVELNLQATFTKNRRYKNNPVLWCNDYSGLSKW